MEEINSETRARLTSLSCFACLILSVRNYLPVGFKLLKVTHSSGRVNAGELGYRELPALPETIDEKVGSCVEKQFRIDVAIHGTDIPEFLESVSKPGQLLQWTLKGQWYVEIYGKIDVWQYCHAPTKDTTSYVRVKDSVASGAGGR